MSDDRQAERGSVEWIVQGVIVDVVFDQWLDFTADEVRATGVLAKERLAEAGLLRTPGTVEVELERPEADERPVDVIAHAMACMFDGADMSPADCMADAENAIEILAEARMAVGWLVAPVDDQEPHDH